MEKQKSLKGKIKISAVLQLKSGLHIGGANDFSPIGAVDSPFIRDPFTKRPIIPGSSLKGKIRTLLAKSYTKGYILPQLEEDSESIQRLFGSAGKGNIRPARLQFFDCQMTEKSFKEFDGMELDTYIGEVKFENSIDRLSAQATPRQIERVPAGVEFDFQVVYNIENEEEVLEDIKMLSEGLKLLQMDYLGGSGSRGYGRVALNHYISEIFTVIPEFQESLQEMNEKAMAFLER